MSESQKWVYAEAKEMTSPRILEMGTRRWNVDKPTHRKWLANQYSILYSEYIMTDFMEGLDVDQLADAHKLSATFGCQSFDVILGYSIFEHLEKPWVVSKEIEKVLKPGGLFFFQTHNTFPIHGYPQDYFRYTTEGLRSIFDWASESRADYCFPCKIVTDDQVRTNCYLNVNIGGRK